MHLLNQRLCLFLILRYRQRFGRIADIDQIMRNLLLFCDRWFGGTNVKFAVDLTRVGA
jgi:hypothetical protein